MKKYNELPEQDKAGKITRGIFVDDVVPEYTAVYDEMVRSLEKTKEDKK